jgi:hypothetical protein
MTSQISNQQSNYYEKDIILYIYLLNNLELISCQGCQCIPYIKNSMYRIKGTDLSYCKECINKWVGIYNNPTTGIKLKTEDIENNYEINDLIKKYVKYIKMDIKEIKINISINKDKNIIVH